MKLRANHRESLGLWAAAACLLTLSIEQTAISQTTQQDQSSYALEQCPTISVSCPTDSGDTKQLTFTASVNGITTATIRYDWAISAGTIVEGQGTPAIKVDMRGTGGRTVTATVDIAGLMSICKHEASCSMIPYEYLPTATLFDRYYPKSIGAAPKRTHRRRKTTRLH